MRFVPEAGSLQIDRPFRISEVAQGCDEGLPVVAGARWCRYARERRDGVGGLRHAVDHALRGCGSDPGSRCSRRKPATRSRGFSTNRCNASMSLMWAASRYFSPPNFTNGMFRRVSSISSGPLWLDVRNRTACSLEERAGLAVLQDAFDDKARLVGLVADGDKLRLRSGRPLGPEVLGKTFFGKTDDTVGGGEDRDNCDRA